MTSSIKFDRHILSLDDTQLEQFVRDWVAQKQEYYEVTPFKGTGDKGRDVVGFLTKERHEGEWHNFQCKQYSSNLGTAKAILEIGKILYYSYSSINFKHRLRLNYEFYDLNLILF